MKAIFENKYNFTEAQINIPFIVGETPMGVVYEVNKDTFTVEIFDKFVGLEILNNNIDAIYLSEKEQISIEEQKYILKRNANIPDVDTGFNVSEENKKEIQDFISDKYGNK